MTDSKEVHTLELKMDLDPSVQQALQALRTAQNAVRQEFENLSKEIRRLESEGLDVRPLVKSMDQLGVSVKAMNRASKETGSTSRQAQTGMDAWRRSIDQFENDISTLPVKIKEVRAQLDRLKASGDSSSSVYQAYNAELRRLTDQQNKLTAANVGSVKSFRNLRGVVQNTAFQVTDFAVSVQNGTRTSVAFAQQAPQLLGAFGAIGAVAGVAATLIAVFAAKWIDNISKTLSPTAALNNATKDLEKTLSSLGVTLNEIDLEPFYKEILKSEGLLAGALTSTLQKDLLSAQTESEAALQALASLYLEPLSVLNKGGNVAGSPFASFFSGLTPALKEAVALEKVQKELGFSTKELALEYKALLSGPLDSEKISAFIIEVGKLDGANKELTTNLKTLLEAAKAYEIATEAASDAAKLNSNNESLRFEVLNSLAQKSIDAKVQELRLNEEIRLSIKRITDTMENGAEIYAAFYGKDKQDNPLEDLQKSYDKMVDSAKTASDVFKDQVQLIELIRTKLSSADENVLAAELERVTREFEKLNSAEIYRNLDTYGKTMYDFAEANVKAAQSQEALNASMDRLDQIAGSNANIREWLRIVQSLGDDAKPEDRVKAMSFVLDEQAKIYGSLTQAVQDYVDENNLSREQTEGLARAFGLQIEKTKELSDVLAGVAQSAVAEFTDTLLDLFTTSENGFDEFLVSLTRMVSQAVIQFAILEAASSIFNGASGGAGGSGRISYDAKGGAYDRGIKMFAQGGVINSPTMFGYSGGLGIAGEAGPEAILPLRRNASGNLGVEASVNVNVVNYAPATEVVANKKENGDVDIVVKRISQDVLRGGNEVARSFERAYGLSRTGGSF